MEISSESKRSSIHVHGTRPSNSDHATDSIEYSAILRKVDWRVVPIMLACYFLEFLDKVLINYANIMGLQDDLGMAGNDFSLMATAFFIAFAVAEIPQGYLLQRFPLARVLGLNLLCWGILVACMAAAQNYAQILAIRILLGCCEAVISPALVMLTSTWYTKRRAAPRYGIWYSGLGAGQIVGGLISFGAQHGPTTGFSGWRIMMVAVGIFNILISLVVLMFLPSTLDGAKFLRPDEKDSIRRMLILDQAGNGQKVFNKKGLFEVLIDPQVWLLTLLTALTVIPSGVITTFSAILIKGFGYDSKQSALLNIPSGAVSIIATYGSTYAVLKETPRWVSIIITLVPALIGAGLMSFLPQNNQGGKLAGIYLLNTTVAPLVLIYSWVGANTAGYTKRIGANAMIAVGFSIANIIGPQTFQTKDSPQYIPAKITLFVVIGVAIFVSALLRVLYAYYNASARLYHDSRLSDGATEHEIATAGQGDLTDREDKGFLYVY
ncbi:hypothetical protein N7520_003572 [Penicillium odoratum]|uniref:uncharacterized protein n=1 Tax=Penicillium odoratum TaxID=1167516 RepID=UPI002548ED86|nr:uncharacterized protein N7520_003572 [Penicillium odoratum]KAJ5769013.1 hypothetical protein N7520_003572 [Penicillium odoratum]